MKNFKFILTASIAIIFLLGFNSCKVINSNALFKISNKDKFVYDSIPIVPDKNYKLCPGDRFNFVFGTNKGERIILAQTGIQLEEVDNLNGKQNQNLIDYLVRQNGIVELPIIGEINVLGMTRVELEDTLEILMSKTYNDPFVQINLTNQRVIVFPGRGKAQVVYLRNTNTSLLEALALAGGIPNESKAYSIRIMRKINEKEKREIYKIDLSKIDGIKHAEMIVQGNDYIYIDYRPRYASQAMVELGPWLSLITTTLAIIAIFR